MVLTAKGLALAGGRGQLSNAASAGLLGLLYGRYSGGGQGIARACWASRQVAELSSSASFLLRNCSENPSADLSTNSLEGS